MLKPSLSNDGNRFPPMRNGKREARQGKNGWGTEKLLVEQRRKISQPSSPPSFFFSSSSSPFSQGKSQPKMTTQEALQKAGTLYLIVRKYKKIMLLETLVLGIVLLLVADLASRKRKSVKGKIVLITGAGSGLGRLLAHKFAKENCHLVLWDINEKGVQEAAKECVELGASGATAMKVDLSDRHDVRKIADVVKREVGDVDILVNNAGVVSGKKMMECSEELIIKTMEVNTLALFWTTRAFLPAMLQRNSGHLVTVASLAGMVGVNGLADYCASKFGAFGFNESMRFELKALKKDGIKTTVVCPFFINTGMFDGVRTKSPNLLPILEPEYAVGMIFDSILSDTEYLVMPRFPYLLTLSRAIFPVRIFDWIIDFLGVNHTMDQFKGKK